MRPLRLWLALAALGTLAMVACSDDEDNVTPYPSVVTEMADLPTNESGVIERILTDGGEEFYLTNPRSGYRAKAVYRGLCGYVKAGSNGSRRLARLASLHTVLLLRDSTATERRADPTRVVSAWRGGEYINLMLTPQTQGGMQYWGYRQDSLRERNGMKHLYLSLHHGQNNDPTSYSETLYASLWLKPLTEVAPGDSLWLTVETTEGPKTWRFPY